MGVQYYPQLFVLNIMISDWGCHLVCGMYVGCLCGFEKMRKDNRFMTSRGSLSPEGEAPGVRKKTKGEWQFID